MKSLLLITLLAVLSGTPFAGIVSVDKMVHDWGDVTVNDGPLECTFKIKNISNKQQTITNVTKTCGCTKVSWSREAINPGEEGVINVTYSNDEGAFAFDKTLSVFFKGIKRPLLLHIRGDVHSAKLPLDETYPIHFEGIGLKKNNIKAGNLLQGESASTELTVANISGRDLVLSWEDVSPFLSITPSTLKIEKDKTGSVHVTVDASRTLWGKNFYTATPVVNGKKTAGKVEFYAITRENFSSWTQKQLDNAPAAESETAIDPTPAARGEKMYASFIVKNTGKSPLVIYRTDYDPSQLKCTKSAEQIELGDQAEFSFEVLTENFEKDSDNYSIATLYTNDPAHPMVHLYIQIIIL